MFRQFQTVDSLQVRMWHDENTQLCMASSFGKVPISFMQCSLLMPFFILEILGLPLKVQPSMVRSRNKRIFIC